MSETRQPRPEENSTVPTIVPGKEGFKIGPDSGGTIPTAHKSSGAKIPDSYGPKGAPVIEP